MTANELYQATLRKLGVLAPSDDITTDEVISNLALVEEAYYHLCAEYGISTVIKTGTGVHLAYMLASDLAPDFVLPESTIQRLAVQRQIAEKKFLSTVREDYDPDQTITAEYF